MSRICPGYIPDISRIYIEAGYIRLIPSLYPAYIREIPAFAMAIPIIGGEVDPDYLNIKTQPLSSGSSTASKGIMRVLYPLKPYPVIIFQGH
jgi:hypothetical protein